MASPERLTSAPLVQIAALLQRRRLSPVELVDAYTGRIEAAGDLHAFITPPGEPARREAQRAEQRLSRGESGALLGVPIAVKDLFATRALRTTAGSRILRNWVPSSDAAVVARLRAAGAIVFGKTNLHEFAYGVSTANPWWGVARLLLDVLSGGEAGRTSRRASTRGLRVGVLGGAIVEKVRPAVSRQVAAAAAALRRRGLRVREVAIPEMEWTVATQLVTLRAEASAVHARWIRTRPRAYGADVRIRLQLGALVTGADYVLAQRMRARIRAAMSDVFHDIDVLLLPSTPIAAPVVGERTVRWRSEAEPGDRALVRLTAPFNLTGLPALSVPYGATAGLPIGVQVVGQWNDEARVLAVGRLIEEEAPTMTPRKREREPSR